MDVTGVKMAEAIGTFVKKEIRLWPGRPGSLTVGRTLGTTIDAGR